MMLWKRWWALTGVTALVLGGLGLWARGKLIGSEACSPPAPVSARPAPCVPVAQTPPPSTAPAPNNKLIPAAVTETPSPVPTPPPATAVQNSQSALPPDEPPSAALTAPPPVAPTTPAPPTVSEPSAPAPEAPVQGLPGYPAAPTASTPPAPVTMPVAPPGTGSGIEPTRLRIPENNTPPPPAPIACPWTLRVEIVEGRPQLEARSGKDVMFRVHCERLNLQAPDGTIVAQGSIKVSAPDMEGVCDKLTINWSEDRVVLEKEVRLKCRKEGQDVELTGDRLTVKLTANSDAKRGGSARLDTPPEPPAESRPATTRTRKVNREANPDRVQTVEPFDGPRPD